MKWVVTAREGDGLFVTEVYGPFVNGEAALRFRDQELSKGVVSAIHTLVEPPVTPSIHPNQTQISDYIDPAVAD